jgi:predicted dehydrogenase
MTVRWGILGCGDIVRKRVANAILDDANSELAAVCRRNDTELRAFCDRFPAKRSYTDDAALLADLDVDAVYVATPVHLHHLHTIGAAAVGKHVLVEKPMALSVAECDEMIASCAEAGVKLGVAYYRRFYPVVRRIKELVADGAVGQPLSITAVTSSPFNLTPEDDGYWRVRLAEGGGGALMDIGSHRLNLMLDLFGPVAEVSALCNTQAADYEAEDSATLLLRFASGVHGTLQCFFGTAVEADEFTVLGTAGRLRCDPLNAGELIIDSADGRTVEQHAPADNLHGPLIADFAQAVTEDRAPVVTGEEGRLTNDVIERAYHTAHGERPASAG